MYHYVRNLASSRFPKIKGHDYALFLEVLDYMEKNYVFISMEEMIAAMEGQFSLPANAALLTFDDGYLDHYTYVFPALEKRKIYGSFFVPSRPILERKVLDVNKVHLILAVTKEMDRLVKDLFEELDTLRKEIDLPSNDSLFETYGVANHLDPKEIIFIKRILQHVLPEAHRSKLTDSLFQKHLDADEKTIAEELYMNMEQIQCMVRNGMHIGSHGYNPYWLGKSSAELQKNDIQKSISFLKETGMDPENLTVCYPYGSFNEDTMRLVEELSFRLGVITKVEVSDITTNNRFQLPRLDINDMVRKYQAD
jgi:peptidoglycan/xylan/chitin deacetylase (PgdA/CDA1 family)